MSHRELAEQLAAEVLSDLSGRPLIGDFLEDLDIVVYEGVEDALIEIIKRGLDRARQSSP